jgi:predicted 3-demethylubiquinone-9 3-methyltransferase (glyoxalase superfamily)
MPASQKIVSHLWFDTAAVEAATFYASSFPDSQLISVTRLRDTPSGDCDVVSFDLTGYAFQAISAGPFFKPNPSISFIVYLPTPAQIDTLWSRLSDGGQTLMPLESYPFSARYGWVQDRFGISWQLTLSENPSDPPVIIPALLFVGDNCGKAEEALHFYTSVFSASRIGQIRRYGPDQAPDREGTILFADFVLEHQSFALSDSAFAHDFGFNEAISFIVNCETQEEIDHYWERLSAVPEAEQCGWLKDRYGVSWQIVPAALEEMMRHGAPEQIARVTQAFLPMKKLDLAALQSAYAAVTE